MTQVIAITVPSDIIKKLQETAVEDYMRPATLGQVAADIIKEHYKKDQ